MFLITIIVVFTVSFNNQCHGQEDQFYYLKYEANLPLTGIINMTEELIKDATQKLLHAEKIQENYKNSANYELGTIAAGVQNIFKMMLELYRTYGNQTEYERNTFAIKDMTYAFHVMQGYYNELRVERALFFQTLAKYKQKQANFKKHMGSKEKKTARRMVGVTPIHNMAGKSKQNNNDQDYKQQLRQNVWKKKWNNFIPEIEGVDIELDNWN